MIRTKENILPPEVEASDSERPLAKEALYTNSLTMASTLLRTTSLMNDKDAIWSAILSPKA